MKAYDWFQARVHVGYANSKRRESTNWVVEHGDVEDRTLFLLKSAFDSDHEGMVENCLKAFWSHYGGERFSYWNSCHVQASSSLLLVNPPADLVLRTASVVTLKFKDSANYGISFNGFPSDIQLRSTGHAVHGLFSDLAVFSDRGVDMTRLAEYVIPGGTLSVVRPNPTVHASWMTELGVGLEFGGLFEMFNNRFKLRPLSSSPPKDDVEVAIYGIESR